MSTNSHQKVLLIAVAAVLCSVSFASTPACAEVRRPVLSGWDSVAESDRYADFLMPASLSPPPAVDGDLGNESLPFYLGEQFRAQNMTVWARFWVSLVGTSISFVRWDERDWLWFGLTVGGTLAFMAPTDPSPDARLQFWVLDHKTSTLNYLLPHLNTEAFAAFGATLIGVSALTGWVGGQPELVEWSSLMLEALGITQFHHVAQKLLIGREGPTKGDGLGIVYGPARGHEFFPSGTPSGHTASVFALATVTMDYFDTLWLDMVGYAFYSYVCVTVLYNKQHFISDVIWGAPMGYFIGKWVARHRSSKYRYVNGEPLRIGSARFVGISPWGDAATGASGLSATWTW